MSQLILAIVSVVAAVVLLSIHIAPVNWILYAALGIYLLIEAIYNLAKKNPIDGLIGVIDLASGIVLIIFIFFPVPLFITFPLSILLLIKSAKQALEQLLQ